MKDLPVSRSLLRSILKRATTVQVDASVYMKIVSYDMAARDELPLLLLAPVSEAQAAYVSPKGYSARTLLRGHIRGDQILTDDGTFLRFFKLSPIPIRENS